ncbi:Coleoptericin domain containing protein [Asbolus verrucosus]|uniref:Coleoptericin domain containing protein n=1 Tax=Asbolus verrucosus TaxID=1661398 RepID=A0A482VNT0_ASBVE|nr:Coleoptericin domain containing protein [Asbolus verrucosus]
MYGKTAILVVISALLAVGYAFPIHEYVYYPAEVDGVYEIYSPKEVVYEQHRARRSLQPGAPGVPAPNQQNGGWSVNPNVAGDDRGNTKATINVEHKGKDHDFHAGWGKVVRGPNKAKPTWNVGGRIRW